MINVRAGIWCCLIIICTYLNIFVDAIFGLICANHWQHWLWSLYGDGSFESCGHVPSCCEDYSSSGSMVELARDVLPCLVREWFLVDGTDLSPLEVCDFFWAFRDDRARCVKRGLEERNTDRIGHSDPLFSFFGLHLAEVRCLNHLSLRGSGLLLLVDRSRSPIRIAVHMRLLISDLIWIWSCGISTVFPLIIEFSLVANCNTRAAYLLPKHLLF